MPENQASGFLTRSDTNQPVQTQKKARGLKFWIYEEELLYCLSSKNKGADQLTAQLICTFVLAYTKIWFSQNGAYFIITVGPVGHQSMRCLMAKIIYSLLSMGSVVTALVVQIYTFR